MAFAVTRRLPNLTVPVVIEYASVGGIILSAVTRDIAAAFTGPDLDSTNVIRSPDSVR